MKWRAGVTPRHRTPFRIIFQFSFGSDSCFQLKKTHCLKTCSLLLTWKGTCIYFPFPQQVFNSVAQRQEALHLNSVPKESSFVILNIPYWFSPFSPSFAMGWSQNNKALFVRIEHLVRAWYVYQIVAKNKLRKYEWKQVVKKIISNLWRPVTRAFRGGAGGGPIHSVFRPTTPMGTQRGGGVTPGALSLGGRALAGPT